MKIAIDGALAGHRKSGVESAVINLAAALAKCGREEYVFFVPPGFPGGDPVSERFKTRRLKLPLRFRPLRILWEHAVLPGLVRSGHADLLHAPAYVAPAAAGVPVVLTVYDLMALEMPELCRRANAVHYRIMMPRSIRRAAGIIVPSEHVRNAVEGRFGPDSCRIKVVPLAADDQFGRLRDEDGFQSVRAKYGVPGRYILFVGRMEPKKNLAGLVRAFGILKSGGRFDGRLVIAGSPGWRCSDIAASVRKHGLEREVLFTGFVPQSDLVRLYNMADLFVLPSFHEGFGIPLVEAMACGVPVICSNRGALPEIAAGAAVIADPEDAGAIAEAMTDVLENGQLRRELIEKGTKRARGFSWQKTAEETERFYREIVGMGS